MLEVQSRGSGPCPPTHVPYELDVLSGAMTQLAEPAEQMPIPSRPGWVLHGWLVPDAHWHTLSIVLSGLPSQVWSADEVQSRGRGP
jgi:hypothetical protein